MSVTVYNPTTGRYVTSLNVSAGAKKQVSTAAIKSKEGGQAAPLTPTVSSVKVTLSSAAKAVLAGTTKLKVSELFAKMQQPGFSPNELSGTTLYVEGGLKDLLPPAVPGSNKLFDLSNMKNATNKTLSLSMADMGLNPLEYKNYNSGDNAVAIRWMGQNSDGSWVEVSDPNLATSFPSNGKLPDIDYTNLSDDIKAFKALRADFSRVPNYEKMLNLLTAQGGRKIVDIRSNNDGPVIIDETTFTQIQKDMRNSTLVRAGASKMTETLVNVANQGTKPITLTGKPGDVVRWYRQVDDPSIPGADLLAWEEVKDPRTPPGAPLIIGANGTANVTVANLPSALQDSPKIKAEVHTSALLEVLGNVMIDLPVSKDVGGNERPVASDLDPATLSRFRQMVDNNQATKVTISGQSGVRVLTPDDVTRLGPKMLARYSGDISIDATTESMTSTQNWENLRVLNNFRSLTMNLDMGVPASSGPVTRLSTATSRLSYQQFIGGYNLLNTISVKPAPIALVPSTYDSATKTQKIQVSGLYLNGDSVQISVLSPSGSPFNLNVGPLVLPKGASQKDQVDALRVALGAALSTQNNAQLAGLQLGGSSNELSLTWPDTSTAPPAPMEIGDVSTASKLSIGLYDVRTRTQFANVDNSYDGTQPLNFNLMSSDGTPVPLNVPPLSLNAGATKPDIVTALARKIQDLITADESLKMKVTVTGNPASGLSFQWLDSGPSQIPPIIFSGSTRAQEYAVTFGADLYDVPPSAVESLVNYPQVTGLNVSGSNDQILNNTDKLNKLISNGFVKSVALVASGTGQLLLTAAQAVRAIPVLEKLIPGSNTAGLVSITDKRSSPTSYASFTDAAASRLRGGIQLIGSSSEILNALKGIGALTRTGKISSITLTGANGSQTIFDNFNAAKLSALTARLRKGG